MVCVPKVARSGLVNGSVVFSPEKPLTVMVLLDKEFVGTLTIVDTVAPVSTKNGRVSFSTSIDNTGSAVFVSSECLRGVCQSVSSSHRGYCVMLGPAWPGGWVTLPLPCPYCCLPPLGWPPAIGHSLAQ